MKPAHALAVVLAMLLALPPKVVHGDECTGVILTPKKMVVQGAEGLWLPTGQAACLAKRAEQTPKLESVVDGLEALNEKLTDQVETSSKALASAQRLVTMQEKRGDEFKATAEKQGLRIEKLEEERDAWYRSPIFWAGIGAATVVIVSSVASALAHAPTINVQ